MIQTLLKSFRRGARPPPAPPAGSRIYAVGDIHGRADLLARLHRAILADAAAVGSAAGAARRLVVYIGDYVDRGLQSREVIDLLLDSALPGFEAVHLKGNHEDMMLRFLADAAQGPFWLANGGYATLASYGVGAPPPPHDAAVLEDLRHRLEAALPPRHRDFLGSLALSHAEGDYLFVHAGVRPGAPAAAQREEDMMWIRDDFLDSRADHGQIVVHGHSINHQPEQRPNRIGIDTGAFTTGHLTCLVLDGAMQRFIA
ncbi:MAG: metallophosphoesterase, partial [Pseudomonadota bacterium]